MTAPLVDIIQKDIQQAIKLGQKIRLPALRGVLTEIVTEEKKGPGITLSNDQVIGIISREKKKYEEAAEFAKQAQREDLQYEALANIEVLLEYLPKQITDLGMEVLVLQAIVTVEATSIKDLGRVMKVLSPEIQGRYDGKKAAELVRKHLS